MHSVLLRVVVNNQWQWLVLNDVGVS